MDGSSGNDQKAQYHFVSSRMNKNSKIMPEFLARHSPRRPPLADDVISNSALQCVFFERSLVVTSITLLIHQQLALSKERERDKSL